MSRNSPKNNTTQVGLTGGIGSGKSVAAQIWEVLGIPVFYADAAGREVLNEDSVRLKVSALLGSDVYVGGHANRSLIADRVFGKPEKLAALNAIVHPAVGRRYNRWVEAHDHAPYVVKEAAILVEIGQVDAYDKIVLVTAPEPLRLSRIMARSGYTEEEGRSRIAAQWSDERKAPYADFLVRNDEVQALIPQVLRIHKALLSAGSA